MKTLIATLLLCSSLWAQTRTEMTLETDQTVSGAKSFKKLNNIRIADQYSSLDAAIADITAGGEVYLPCGTYTVASAIAISVDGVRVRGSGLCSKISVTGTTDVFQVSAALFRLEDVQVTINTTSSRSGSAIVHATSAAGAQGYIGNVRAQGDATTVNNGIFFLNDQPGAGLWIVDRVRIINSGAPWQAFVKLTSSTGTSIASNAFDHLVSGSKWTDAAIVIDGYVDTFKLSHSDLAAPAGTAGPTIWVRNTVGAGTNPRWIHFTDVSVEASGQTAVQIDNCRDCRYIGGYISGATIGVAIGSNARDSDISHNVISQMQNQAITLAQTSSHTTIAHNWFDDIGIATTNTYNGIEVAAATLDFSIIGNHFRIFDSANVTKNAIAILSGASNNYTVALNDIPSSTFGTAALSDLGSGTAKFASLNTSNAVMLLSAGTLAIGGDTTMSSAPRMAFGAFLPGALTGGAYTATTLTTEKAITITRVQVQVKTAPVTCSPNAVIRVGDNVSNNQDTTLTATANDSGLISLNFAASTNILIRFITAAAGCGTSPADANVTVQYKMQ